MTDLGRRETQLLPPSPEAKFAARSRWRVRKAVDSGKVITLLFDCNSTGRLDRIWAFILFNPYQSPTATDDARSIYSESERAELRTVVQRRIRWPLLGLIVASGIGAVWSSMFLIIIPVAYFMGSLAGEDPLANIAGNGVFAIYNVLMAFAYHHVRNLRVYRSALLLAMVGVVPCLSPGFILGIPFGLWLLIALSQPRTADAFDRRT
jgi:hypothetical protein